MKYVGQIMIISVITFLGELLNLLLPLPVPASVYGMLLLFLCLQTRLIRLEQIAETADFLLLIMPVFFISPSVGLIDTFVKVADSIVGILVISVVSTVTVMAATGLIAQGIIGLREKKGGKSHE